MWSMYMEMMGRGLLLGTTAVLLVDSKIFEKLQNNRFVNHIKKCGLCSKFQYGFRSSQSIADLLPDVSNRTCRAFTRFGAAQPIALDISKTFAGLPHKLKSNGIFLQKFLQKYSTKTWVAQGSILEPDLFLHYINDLLDDVICNIVIYANDASFYSKCDQV